MMTSPGIYNNGSVSLFEWGREQAEPGSGVPNSVRTLMVRTHAVFPTGQILFTDYSNDVEIYRSPGGSLS